MTLRFDVITIFPGLFEPFLRESLVGAAIRASLLENSRAPARIAFSASRSTTGSLRCYYWYISVPLDVPSSTDFEAYSR